MLVVAVLALTAFPPALSAQTRKKKEKTEPAERLPEPSADAQAKAEETLKDLYKVEFARKKPRAMLALALKLYQLAGESTNAAERFVMLREARDLAVKAGNAQVALGAIDALTRRFKVKGLAMKVAALDALAKKVRASATRYALVVGALLTTREAVGADDYDTADQVMELAKKVAGRVSSLKSVVQDRAKFLAVLKEDFPKLKAARDKLQSDPDDPDANLKVGKFLCLALGKWREGMTFLAKGGDAKLKALAQKVGARPQKPAALVAVGEGIWDWSEREEGGVKADLQEWAREWYWKALPRLEGLDKTKAEQRLQIKLGRLVLRPGLVALLYNDTKFARAVKARVDYQIDFDWGQGSPDPLINKDNFGIRWFGYLKAPRPGLYTFRIKSDNGCRIWLGRAKIVDKLSTNGTYDLTVEVPLGDQPVPIVVEFLEGILTAYMHLHWIAPGETEAVPVPPSAFYHSTKQEKVLRR
jgi:hypothetical protein